MEIWPRFADLWILKWYATAALSTKLFKDVTTLNINLHLHHVIGLIHLDSGIHVLINFKTRQITIEIINFALLFPICMFAIIAYTDSYRS